jgi:butyryl-CoA dehydrogenase
VDLSLSEDQLLVRQAARDFAQQEVLPKAASIDREHRHPHELVKRMAELGFLGMTIAETHGGAGLDCVSYALAVEEIARACASTAVIMSVNNSLVCDPLAKYGTESQKREWLTPLASGSLLGCFALSEPGAGSDSAAQQTTATRRADGSFVVAGTKNWITNGPVADVCILFAMTDRNLGHKGISGFIVPMKTPGVRCGSADDKMGIRGSKSSQIFLDDVELPGSALLGEIGGGFKIAMSTLDGGRIGIAAQAVGITRACLEDSTSYARQRRAFGKAIAEHQAIAFKLADMATELEAARLLTLRAAHYKQLGKAYSKEAAMAKLYASDVANRAAREAIQIFGGNGYVTEFPVERHFRDAKITEIYEGTSEIQRQVITSQLVKSGL